MQDMQGSCTCEAMMDKLHAVMHLLGWEHLKARVGLADQVTLAAARRYWDLKQWARLEGHAGQFGGCRWATATLVYIDLQETRLELKSLLVEAKLCAFLSG